MKKYKYMIQNFTITKLVNKGNEKAPTRSLSTNLGTKENAIKYVRLFNKLLKQKGKLIIDSNLDGKNNYKIINHKLFGLGSNIILIIRK